MDPSGKRWLQEGGRERERTCLDKVVVVVTVGGGAFAGGGAAAAAVGAIRAVGAVGAVGAVAAVAAVAPVAAVAASTASAASAATAAQAAAAAAAVVSGAGGGRAFAGAAERAAPNSWHSCRSRSLSAHTRTAQFSKFSFVLALSRNRSLARNSSPVHVPPPAAAVVVVVAAAAAVVVVVVVAAAAAAVETEEATPEERKSFLGDGGNSAEREREGHEAVVSKQEDRAGLRRPVKSRLRRPCDVRSPRRPRVAGSGAPGVLRGRRGATGPPALRVQAPAARRQSKVGVLLRFGRFREHDKI